MPIEIRTMEAASQPAVVGHDKEGRDVLCKCCQDHRQVRVALMRGSAFELRTAFPPWFASLGIKELISHAQSESEGNLTISVVYR